MAIDVQPAIKSYFFGKGYQDLKNTIQDSWEANLDSARDYFSKAEPLWRDRNNLYKIAAAGYGFAALSVVVFGTLVFVLLSLVHVLVLLVFFGAIYLGFATVLGIEQIYMARNRIFGACHTCHEKFDIPHYLCPNCRRIHTRLIPCSYGILKRTCECGEKLPTTFFNGRKKLEAQCPVCSKSVESAESTPICLPIVGGPSVGKTFFMYAATQTLLETLEPAYSWHHRFMNTLNERQYQQLQQNFQRGQIMNKTVDTTPMAFNFFLESPRWSPEKLVYIYDAAGEAFKTSDHLVHHKFYGYLHGLFLLIDPFSLPEIYSQYQRQIEKDTDLVRPSEDSIEDIFDRLMINFEAHFQIKRDATIKQPCAIIINKVDAFDLRERLGETAIRRMMASDPALSHDKAMDMNCRQFFRDLGYHNLLNQIEQKFKVCRFFACSTTGHPPDGTAFQAEGIEAPLRWILSLADRHLQAELKA